MTLACEPCYESVAFSNGSKGFHMAINNWLSARNLALFAAIALIANAIWARADTEAWTGTFYLALVIHLGLGLYDARFSDARKWSWLILVGLWILFEILGFLGFMLPMGQIAYWLASILPLGLVEPLTSAPILPLVGFVALAVDATVWRLTGEADRRLVGLFILIIVAILAGLGAGLLLGALLPPPSPDELGLGFAILPAWYELPIYALLRAVPDKLGGVVLVLAALLVLLPWPWLMRRRPDWGWLWVLCCLLLASVWVALGYIGAQSADNVMLPALLLAACHFAFFLVLPVLARRSAG